MHKDSLYINIGGLVYCRIKTLTSIGIKYRTIEFGYRHKASHWQSIKDPSDNRKRLIAYEPMKEKYKQLVIAKYGNPYEWLKQQELDDQFKILEELEERLNIDSFHYNFFQKHYAKTKAYQYAKVSAWLELTLNLKGCICKEWGFEGKKHFLEQLAIYLKDKGLPISMNSRAVIERRRGAYKKAKKENEEAALASLIDKRGGGDNPRKLGKEQEDYLIALMSRSSKPPIATVKSLYNRKAREMGWNEICERTASNYINKPSNVKRWYFARHDKKATYNNLEISTGREKASAPDILWMMDGTPIDLYYKERREKYNDDKQAWEWTETKWNRLNMFCIMDAHSWKIIGYYLSDRENHIAVIEALRDAVRKCMTLPMQIMYDRSSANRYVGSLLKELAKYNTANKAYRAKPKTLEPLFGHFQQKMLRYNDNWAGQNITAGKLDSRVNPEALKEAMKNLPNREQLMQKIELLVATWNELATEKRRRPNYLYTAKKSKGQSIDWMSFSNLFFVVTEKEYKYHNDGGLKITIDKQEYNFQTYDQQLHFNLLVNQKFQIAYDPDTMDYIYLYKNNKPVLDEKGQPVLIPKLDKLPQAIGDYKKGESGKKVQAYVEAQNEGTRLLKQWADETEAIAAEHEIKLTPEFVHKGAYNRAEETLKRQQAMDESCTSDWEEIFNNPYNS